MSGVVRASTSPSRLVKVAFILLAVLAYLADPAAPRSGPPSRASARPLRLRRGGAARRSSVVVPAYNEELGIEASVRSLAASDYPASWRSSSSTTAPPTHTPTIVASLGLPSVRLIRQANAGKPAALNTGFRRPRHAVLVLVDGDTVFERDALQSARRTAGVAPRSAPCRATPRSATGVGCWAGGSTSSMSSASIWTGGCSTCSQCMPTVPGAIGAFRRQALIDAGGISSDTLAEDTDLTMAICRAGWRVVYAPDARAWTEAPASLGQLWRQRYRWCYGTMQAMWKHRQAVRRAGRRRASWDAAGLPYLLAFQVVLPLLAPAIDIATLYSIVFAWSRRNRRGLARHSSRCSCSLPAYAFRLDREPLRPLWSLPLQQFVYRQLMYLVVIQSSGQRAVRAATALAGDAADRRNGRGPLVGRRRPAFIPITPVRAARRGPRRIRPVTPGQPLRGQHPGGAAGRQERQSGPGYDSTAPRVIVLTSAAPAGDRRDGYVLANDV